MIRLHGPTIRFSSSSFEGILDSVLCNLPENKILKNYHCPWQSDMNW